MNLFSKPHDISKGVTMALSKILFTFVAVSWLTCSAQQVSPTESLVFGSGIDPRRNTQPYYYVYVQLRTTDGLKYVSSMFAHGGCHDDYNRILNIFIRLLAAINIDSLY